MVMPLKCCCDLGYKAPVRSGASYSVTLGAVTVFGPQQGCEKRPFPPLLRASWKEPGTERGLASMCKALLSLSPRASARLLSRRSRETLPACGDPPRACQGTRGGEQG